MNVFKMILQQTVGETDPTVSYQNIFSAAAVQCTRRKQMCALKHYFFCDVNPSKEKG